ncbi:unnamed protein product [Cylicocyclus nassatus]|uniref:Uncharacterized protein n=1 Tax=Cylicocyclus nassatus TaxID=53992 RepID=A0AA36GZA1_CYLNA|nr:unnamed protein product [Cylicocyclus nassatus]
MEYVRITGIGNPRRRPLDYVLKEFGEDVLKVPETIKEWFSWPAPAGTKGSSVAIRAKITYPFWKFFINEGRKNLSEYNKVNEKNIIHTKPAIIAICLDIDLSEWNGLPLDALLTDEERKLIESGVYKRGTFILERLENFNVKNVSDEGVMKNVE